MWRLSIFFLLFVPNLSAWAGIFSSLDKYERAFTVNLDMDYNYQDCRGIELGMSLMKYNVGVKKVQHMMEFGLHLSSEYNFL